jgi:hypothetical protein
VGTDDSFNNFIAGFVSGEGSFFVTTNTHKYFRIQCGFSIKVRADDFELLRSIWSTLNFAGNIHHIATKRYKYKWDSVQQHDSVLLIVRKMKDLTDYIIPFFDKYLLRGQKRRNYELWKQVVAMMNSGEHRTAEGIEKILALKAEMNRYQGQDEVLPAEADIEASEEAAK